MPSKPRIVWITVLISIPLLSIYGRSLEVQLKAFLSSTQLGVLLAICSLALLGLLGATTPRHLRGKRVIHLIWAAILFLLLPLTLPTVAERLHLIVFGVFGFFSVANFGFCRSLAICTAVSGLDELLQWVLPDRVGDWRDVGLNLLACLGGCLLSIFLGNRDETTGPAAA
ncbi:VanZ family protein [bacterium]|nr:VanZ family protein [bacterium]